MSGFEPKIAAFFCNWCTYTAADLAGVSRIKHDANARIIRVMCSGRVDPQFVLDAFAKGADGVLLGGCHPGDCHYAEGNTKTLRRMRMLERMLKAMGVEDGRFRLEWISGAEGDKVKATVQFRGREMSRLELGTKLLKRLAEDIGERGAAEGTVEMAGNRMHQIFGPTKKAKKAAGAPEAQASEQA